MLNSGPIHKYDTSFYVITERYHSGKLRLTRQSSDSEEACEKHERSVTIKERKR